MPPAATDLRATSALDECAGSPARSAFLRFAHLHCLHRTQKTVHLLAAVRSDPSPSAVHDLRVAARRLLYALDCFSAVLNTDRAADLRKRVKGILSTARAVRELDVALELVSATDSGSGCSLAAVLQLQRDAAAQTMSERLGHKRFRNLTHRWLGTASASAPEPAKSGSEATAASVRASTHLPWMPDESCATNASRVLPLLAAQYFRQGRTACAEGASHEALHTFRLDSKRLRYCLEIFRDQYGPSMEARIDLLRDIQRRLGVLSDCASTAELLRSAGMPSDTASERLLTILRQRQEDATESFLAHWEAHLGALEVERDWRDCLALSSEEASPTRSGSPKMG